MSQPSLSDTLLQRNGPHPDWLDPESQRVDKKLQEIYGAVQQEIPEEDKIDIPEEADDAFIQLTEKAQPYLSYRHWLRMMKDYFQGIDVDEHERRYRRYVRPLLDNFAKRAQDEGNANVFARRFSVKNPVDDLSTDRIAVYSENYRSQERLSRQGCTQRRSDGV